MVEEADKSFPNESGGVLMGYWVSDSELVITDAIGPGPNALHTPFSFVPDSNYHEISIAEIYQTSGRLHSYLGDWHNHTNERTVLSLKDKRTLFRIARSKTARAPNPIMAILGKSDEWVASIWLLSPWLLWDRKVGWTTHDLNVKVY